jgi:uncharacterized protein YutE (UPF0331/DUF86 family)
MDMEALLKTMPWLTEHGYYEWQHTGFPLGEFLAWKVEDGKAKVRVGIHDTASSNIDWHDDMWKEIKRLGDKGESSIKGITNVEAPIIEAGEKVNEIRDIGLWTVGWVGDQAANPEADVTFVSQVKSLEVPLMKRKDGMELRKRILNQGQEDSISATDMIEMIAERYVQKKDEKITEKEKVRKMKKLNKQDEEEEVVEEPEEEPEAAPVEAVAEAVEVIAEALSDIDAGTPEAVEEVAEAAEEAVEILEEDGGGEEVEEEDETEMAKELNDLKKTLVDALKVIKHQSGQIDELQKRLKKPVTEKRSKPIQPKSLLQKSVSNRQKAMEAFQRGDPKEGRRLLGFKLE